MPKIKVLLGSLGIFLLLLGLVFFFFPTESIRVVVIIIALGMIISGGFAIWIALKETGQNFRTLTFLLGTIDVILGILFLSTPGLANSIGSFIVVLIGLGVSLQAFFLVQAALQKQKAGIGSGWIQFLWAIVLGIVWLFMIINAFWSFMLMARVMGLSFLIAGIHILIISFQLKNEQLIIIQEQEIILDPALDADLQDPELL